MGLVGLVAGSSVLSAAGSWRGRAGWTWEDPTFGCILCPTCGQLDSDLRDCGSRRADKLLVDFVPGCILRPSEDQQKAREQGMSACCPSRVFLFYQRRHCEGKLSQGRISACSMIHSFKDIICVKRTLSPS